MKTNRFLTTSRERCTARLVASLLLLLGMIPAFNAIGDTVTMKDGTSVEGRITVEGTDILRIEVQVTPSIKETKTYSMTDIAKIEKTAADKLAFAGIKEGLPTRSLMTASDYDTMIRNGPKKFLSSFPESEHKAEVEKILAELEAEKERVQRGGLKLDGEWIEREERQLYRFAVDARVRLDRIRQKAAADNLLGALRDFQAMEKSFAETPAYVTAVEEAQKIISAWGSTLQRKLANADILNQRDEAALKLQVEDQRRRVQEARDAERDRFAEILRQEKERGVVWVSVSDRDRPSLESAISIAKTQLDNLRALDLPALKKQAEGLTEANRLLGVGDLAEARLTIAESAVGRSSSKSNSRSRSKSKSKTSGPEVPTKYSQWLLQRISDEEAILAEKAKAAAESTKVAAVGSPATDKSDPAADAEGKVDGDATPSTDAGAEATTAGTPSRAEIMAAEKAREQAKKAAEKKAADDADSKKKSRSKKSSGDEDDSDEKKKTRPASSGGGGINIQILVPIIAVLLIVTVLVLKKFGIGGKPAE